MSSIPWTRGQMVARSSPSDTAAESRELDAWLDRLHEIAVTTARARTQTRPLVPPPTVPAGPARPAESRSCFACGAETP
jgi:hypothetical protein